MLEYITENKEWLFSGAGVAVVTVVVSFIFKRKSHNIPKSDQQLDVKDKGSSNHSNIVPTELTEIEKVAKRFWVILELMNEGRNYSKFTIPQLAQIMKLHKISELENVFTGKLEPSFSFIEDFSKTFGVNKTWLTEGKESPYSNELPSQSDPMDYLPVIDGLDPEGIYFVRENSDTAPAFIIIKNLKITCLVSYDLIICVI